MATSVSMEPRLRRRILWVAVGVALFHLLIGVYYATRAENLKSKPTLNRSGDAFLASYEGWNTQHEGDASFYNRTAVEILRGGVPRDHHGRVTLHAPVYSYFLAACYKVGGFRLLSVAVPQALLCGLIAWLLAWAAWRLAPDSGNTIPLLAAVLFGLNLRFAMYVGYINPTILLLALIALAFLVSTHLYQAHAVAFLSAVMSLAVVTQAAAFVLALGVTLALLLTRRFSTRVGAAALLGFVALILVLPLLGLWTDKKTNFEDTGRTDVLLEANNPYYESMRATGLWGRRPGNPWSDWRPSEQEQQRYDQYLARTSGNPGRAALLWIRENPGQYVKLCSIRLRTTLGPFTSMMSPRNRAISTFFWLLIFPAGLYGVWRLRHQPVTSVVLCVFLTLTAFETLVITEWYLRYRLPVDLMLTAYAAVGYATLVASLRAESKSPTCPR